jgi:hypothetical protein
MQEDDAADSEILELGDASVQTKGRPYYPGELDGGVIWPNISWW